MAKRRSQTRRARQRQREMTMWFEEFHIKNGEQMPTGAVEPISALTETECIQKMLKTIKEDIVEVDDQLTARNGLITITSQRRPDYIWIELQPRRRNQTPTPTCLWYWKAKDKRKHEKRKNQKNRN